MVVQAELLRIRKSQVHISARRLNILNSTVWLSSTYVTTTSFHLLAIALFAVT